MKLIAEIKRRKVVQATAIYAAAAWLIAQVASVVEQPLNLPAWFDTAAIVVVLLGFPLVIVMSWFFTLTSAGLAREPSSAGSQQETSDGALARAADGSAVVASTAPPPRIVDKPSIAVLPFKTLGGDSDQDSLADGLVESITAGLSLVRSFFVISRNSAFTFKSRVANAIDIGRELGVGYLLEGSVQRSAERIRITVQLVETEAGAHIWARHHDGTTQNLFDLQDEITESVVGALQPSIRLAEIERSGRKRPQAQGAYDLTMRAMRHVWALEKDECQKAVDLLDQALIIEPGYPLALSLAGWCHAQRGVYNWSDDIAKSRKQAQDFAERAAELSSDDPLILTVLGTVYTIVRKFGVARSLLERAVALDPNASWAWQRLGWLKTYLGHYEEALEHFQRALRLSPVDPMNFNVRAGMGSAHEGAQRFDDSVREYQRALEERPNAYWIYRHLAAALYTAGRTAEAKQAFATLMAHFPELTVARVREALLNPEPSLTRVTDSLKALGLR